MWFLLSDEITKNFVRGAKLKYYFETQHNCIMLSLDRDDKLDESNGEFIYELNQTNYKECSPVLRTSLYNFKQLFRCPRSDFR